MKKIVLISILLTTFVNGEVFAIKNEIEQNKTSDLNNKNSSNLSNFNKLPYNLSQKEIIALPDGPEKTEAQELYDFMKLSFNIISNNSEELYKLFISEKQDIKLINFCKKIMSNENNYKHFGNDSKQNFNSAKNILNSKKPKYNQYINDIIHDNIYSVIFDVLIEKYKLDANCFRRVTRDYINNNIIQKICDNIQNKYRKEIINSVLNNYLLHKTPENLSASDYEEHIIRTNGIHRDKYNNYSNHIIFSGLGFDTFMQIIKCLDESNVKSQLQKFKNLIKEGYITNPNIVTYIENNYK